VLFEFVSHVCTDDDKTLNVRFVVERSVDELGKQNTSDSIWSIEVDAYVDVPEALPFRSLVRHALLILGYSELETVSCKGELICRDCFVLFYAFSVFVNFFSIRKNNTLIVCARTLICIK